MEYKKALAFAFAAVVMAVSVDCAVSFAPPPPMSIPDLSCILNVMMCEEVVLTDQDYNTSRIMTNPSDTCCNSLKNAIEISPLCLCQILVHPKDSEIYNSTWENPEDGAKLFPKCHLSNPCDSTNSFDSGDAPAGAKWIGMSSFLALLSFICSFLA